MRTPGPNDWLPVSIGELIDDKYRVDGFIGAGGMGSVVAATHLQLLKRVAIKFLQPTDDPAAATRFMREARAAVALASAHVARVLDVGELEDPQTPYLVMEYLDGETLSQRMRRQPPMSVDEIVTVMKQVCEALGEAHAKGIVHRDVKPANIYLAQPDTGSASVMVKVLDFGIAKSLDPGVGVELSITGTSQVLGTPRYMAPEQISSTRNVDTRADVWGLGVCFFECLVGKPPFEGANAFEVGMRILSTDAAPIASTRPDVPMHIAAIVDRCLRRETDERFANAGEVLTALNGHMPARFSMRSTTPLITGTGVNLAEDAFAETAMAASPPVEITQRDTSTRISRGFLIGGGTLVVVLVTALVAVTTILVRQRPAIDSNPQPTTITSTPAGDSTSKATATTSSTTASAVVTVEPSTSSPTTTTTTTPTPSLGSTTPRRAAQPRRHPTANPSPSPSPSPSPATTPSTRPTVTAAPDQR